MTTHYVQQEQKIFRDVVISVTCDKCDKEIQRTPGYHTREFTLEFSQGESYPDGGHRIGWQVEDLCDECVEFLERLLKSNGFKLAKLEVDW